MSLRGTRDPDAGGGPAYKLTARRKAKIVQAIKAGNYAYVAAARGGIARSTFFRYMQVGEELLEQALADGVLTEDQVEEADAMAELAAAEGNVIPNPIGEVLRAAGWPEHKVLQVELVDEVHRAESEAELRLVTLVSKAAEDDWRAAIALLSRRHPDRWKEHVGADHSGVVATAEVGDGEMAKAIAEDPEARDLASQLLARVAPVAPPSSVTHDDDEALDDEVGEGVADGED